MKIGMVVNNMEISGGYHKLVIRLAQQLERKGHEVITYTLSVDRKKCYPDDINTINIIELNEHEKKGSISDQIAKLANKIAADLDVLIIHDQLSLNIIALSKLSK